MFKESDALLSAGPCLAMMPVQLGTTEARKRELSLDQPCWTEASSITCAPTNSTLAVRSWAAVPRLGVLQAFLHFGIPAVVFSVSLLWGLPLLVRNGASPFLTFNLAFGSLNALLLVAALVAYKLEGHAFTWYAFRSRMRLRAMDWHGWPWALLLCIVAPFVQRPFELLEPWFPRVRLYTPPSEFVSFLQQQVFSVYAPHGSFLGIPLRGDWWVAAYYFAFLIVLNVLGEELWWRAYVLPQQEVAHGRWAWAINGVFWEASTFSWTRHYSLSSWHSPVLSCWLLSRSVVEVRGREFWGMRS
jgi:hypothetical protein